MRLARSEFRLKDSTIRFTWLSIFWQSARSTRSRSSEKPTSPDPRRR
jgi:hypothetical protein